MRHRGWLRVPAAAVLFWLLAACGDDATAVEEYEVAGFVRDGETRRGLSGAEVTFTSDTLFRKSTSTDEDGYYEMTVSTDVPIGRVRATRAGYDPGEASVYFDQRTRRVDIELRAGREMMEEE